MDLSIILPAYLEEENLRLLVPRLKTQCQRLTSTFEIIVVDTMKTMDGTEQLCLEHQITYVHRTGGESYGCAVRTGIKHSKGEFVIFMDADGSHAPSFIEKLFNLRSLSTVCVASRYVKGGYTENSRLLVWMSLIVNIGYRVILNIKCKDVSNSFKLYPGNALRLLELKCSNFDIVEEIFLKILKKNPTFNIVEIPFSFKKRMFGKTKRNLFVFMFTYLITLIRLRLDL
jgi:dolichol-phosphate mannosyltransferase